MKRRIFIICPVRNISEEEKAFLDKYVRELEEQGSRVHYPPRDTDQNDPTGGIKICAANREAILMADEVHIFWKNSDSAKSSGSFFDLGMTFVFLHFYNRKIIIINKDEVRRTPHKSFENVILDLEEMTKEE